MKTHHTPHTRAGVGAENGKREERKREEREREREERERERERREREREKKRAHLPRLPDLLAGRALHGWLHAGDDDDNDRDGADMTGRKVRPGSESVLELLHRWIRREVRLPSGDDETRRCRPRTEISRC